MFWIDQHLSRPGRPLITRVDAESKAQIDIPGPEMRGTGGTHPLWKNSVCSTGTAPPAAGEVIN